MTMPNYLKRCVVCGDVVDLSSAEPYAKVRLFLRDGRHKNLVLCPRCMPVEMWSKLGE